MKKMVVSSTAALLALGLLININISYAAPASAAAASAANTGTEQHAATTTTTTKNTVTSAAGGGAAGSAANGASTSAVGVVTQPQATGGFMTMMGPGMTLPMGVQGIVGSALNMAQMPLNTVSTTMTQLGLPTFATAPLSAVTSLLGQAGTAVYGK